MCVGLAQSKTNIVNVSSCDEVIHELNQYIYIYVDAITLKYSPVIQELMFFNGPSVYCHFRQYYWSRCSPYAKFPPDMSVCVAVLMHRISDFSHFPLVLFGLLLS